MSAMTYEDALRQVIPPEAGGEDAWETCFPSRPPLVRPTDTAHAWINAGALSTPWAEGAIEVDFAKRTVTFTGSNQKEGYLLFEVTVRPAEDWWQVAMALDWPSNVFR